MAEWSNAAVLKTVVPKGTGGSNPSFSAKETRNKCFGFFISQKRQKFIFVSLREIKNTNERSLLGFMLAQDTWNGINAINP